MLLRTIASLAVAILAAIFVVQPVSAQAILFEGARVITGDGSAAIDNAALLVERGVITRIGRKGDIALPPGRKMLSGARKGDRAI